MNAPQTILLVNKINEAKMASYRKGEFPEVVELAASDIEDLRDYRPVGFGAIEGGEAWLLGMRVVEGFGVRSQSFRLKSREEHERFEAEKRALL